MRTAHGHLYVDLNQTSASVGAQHPELDPSSAAEYDAERARISERHREYSAGWSRETRALARRIFDHLRQLEIAAL